MRAPTTPAVLLPLAIAALATLTSLAGCADAPTAAPHAAHLRVSRAAAGASWGPETPPFNLQAVLRAPAGHDGFGLVKFRQPNDADRILYLDVWVRDLAPNATYLLQRAADTVVDGVCTGTNWLTLGEGTTPRAITTDARGTGRAALFRDIAGVPVGTTFDIHFRVVDTTTDAVVLTSGCYQFTVTQ